MQSPWFIVLYILNFPIIVIKTTIKITIVNIETSLKFGFLRGKEECQKSFLKYFRMSTEKEEMVRIKPHGMMRTVFVI